MERSGPGVDDLVQYELTLRRRATARVADGGDAELVDLFRTISDRRSSRAPVGSAGSVAPMRPARGAGSTETGRAPSGRDGRADDSVDGPQAKASTSESRSTEPDRAVTGGAPSEARSPGRVLSTESYGPTVRVFRIGRPPGFTFVPGQYLKAGVRGGKREDFSIASAPHDPHLELAIELRAGGRVTPALFALSVGDTVDVGDRAKGKLLLASGATHHFMVATVTGIAPLRSMLRDALHRGTSASFTVLVGASHSVELPYHAELSALAEGDERVTYVPTVSRPTERGNRSWTGTTGRVDDVARPYATRLSPSTTHVYAVGHPGMIANVRKDFGAQGFQITTESYGS